MECSGLLVSDHFPAPLLGRRQAGRYLLIYYFLEVGLQDDHQLFECHPFLHVDWNFLLVFLIFVVFRQWGENSGSFLQHGSAEGVQPVCVFCRDILRLKKRGEGVSQVDLETFVCVKMKAVVWIAFNVLELI